MSTAPAERPDDLVAAMAAMAAILRDQDGVIARRQVEEVGGTASDIARLVRRKELVRVLPGIFVEHTGKPTWQQRAWAGVLAFWPAALAEESAARATAGPGWRKHDEDGPITIAVDVSRNVREAPGYRVRRLVRLDSRVQWNRTPPRVRFEDTIIDLVQRAGDRMGAIATLTNACQSRSTNASRLLTTLDARARVSDRAWLRQLLGDIADGTCSVLEQGYLDLVERPHGFPLASRNVPDVDDGRRCFRDVVYEELDLIVELDGRAFHEDAGRRDADLDRDLRAATDGRTTVRLGWGQVFDRPCATSDLLGAILRQQGWQASPHPCGPECVVGREQR